MINGYNSKSVVTQFETDFKFLFAYIRPLLAITLNGRCAIPLFITACAVRVTDDHVIPWRFSPSGPFNIYFPLLLLPFRSWLPLLLYKNLLLLFSCSFLSKCFAAQCTHVAHITMNPSSVFNNWWVSSSYYSVCPLLNNVNYYIKK